MNQYAIFLLYLLAILGFVGFTLLLNRLLGPKPAPTPMKLEPFECGATAIERVNVKAIPIKYYGVAIVFILFDLETVFLFLWALGAQPLTGWLLFTFAFFVFLLVQFIRQMPRDMDEAARIDGAGHVRIFWAIILPLIKPALITCAIFAFIWSWNDFLGPLLYLTSPENYPLPIALRLYNDQTSTSDYGATVTASFVALIPVLLFFIVFQRFLINGVATEGLKG